MNPADPQLPTQPLTSDAPDPLPSSKLARLSGPLIRKPLNRKAPLAVSYQLGLFMAVYIVSSSVILVSMVLISTAR